MYVKHDQKIRIKDYENLGGIIAWMMELLYLSFGSK